MINSPIATQYFNVVCDFDVSSDNDIYFSSDDEEKIEKIDLLKKIDDRLKMKTDSLICSLTSSIDSKINQSISSYQTKVVKHS